MAKLLHRRPSRAHVVRQLFASLGRVLVTPILGLLFLIRLITGRRRSLHAVTFCTYPPLVFSWLLIFLGFAFWPFATTELVSLSTLGWIYAIVVIATVLTMGIDINRNAAAFWLVIIIACWFAVLWLRDVKGLVVFSRIYQSFAALDMAYHRDAALLVSVILGVAYLLMLAWARINSMWRITHNEFEHCALGRVDDSLGRGAKGVRAEYPDLFEFILCLAGDLLIFDSAGKRLIRRIPHVPLLPLVRSRINHVLEATLVVTDETAAQQYEEEEAEEYDTEETVEPEPTDRG